MGEKKMIEVKYDCGCKYYHHGEDKVETSHLCTDHKIDVVNDRLKEMGEEKEERLPWTDPREHP